MNILRNPTGKKGHFRPIDWVIEHNNLYIKVSTYWFAKNGGQTLKYLSVNLWRKILKPYTGPNHEGVGTY